MGWKDWPYWLRGGIIGFVIGLIPLILSQIFLIKGLLAVIYGVFVLPPELILLNIIPASLKNIFFDMGSCFILCIPRFLGFLVIALFYFLVGALIGSIISKIKSIKQEQIKQ